MMDQIVKRKKKGRPSKADLARRAAAAAETSTPEPAEPEKEIRRSGRRRNVRYTFDFDDYLDYDDEYFIEDDEDDRGREKKLKHLLKLQSNEGGGGPAESTPSRTRSASSSDYADFRKKREIEGDEMEEEEEEENDEDNDYEARGSHGEAKGVDSAPGTPVEAPSGIPLPDKKTLELILDKLQKKDLYGVYAEPVDPEELPDYHEVIEHPMDFATVRNKLRNGSYATLEQLESDIFLICSNAMLYNTPDTIYYKQAHSIQDLAKKKFEKLRITYDRSEKEVKLEQKTKYGSVVRKQIKKPIVQTLQEPLGSDFSSGATLAAAGENHNVAVASHAGLSEKPFGVNGLAEGNSSTIDHNFDKAEESLPGKGPLSRFGRKPSVHDENRRTTHCISTEPVSITESTFSTFDCETKQLVTVGLYSDHAYGRSLARYAASLGSVAWRVASKKIEQALPPGFKFGRGWVGEYEPLPTPVLMLESYTLKEPAFLSEFQHTLGAKKNGKMSSIPVSPKDSPLARHILEGKSAYLGSTRAMPSESSLDVLIPANQQYPREISLEGRPSFLTSRNKPPVSASPSFQHQNLQPYKFIESEKKLPKQVELNCPSSANQRNADSAAENLMPHNAEIPGSRSIEVSPRNRSPLLSGSFKRPNMNGIDGALPNGKAANNSSGINAVPCLATDCFPKNLTKAATIFPLGQEHGLSDPVEQMRMFAGKAQNQQISLNQARVDGSPVSPVTPSLRRDDSGNAAVAAARAWMSIGAGALKQGGETSPRNHHISADSLYNPSRDLQQQASRFRGELPPSGVHFQPEKNNFPLNAFVHHPVRVGNETQFQNHPMAFPQSDLSRFQVQTPWQSLNSLAQPRQKQESFPPDLNISFQSSGSPGRPSSGVLVDSQQPDLALQL